MLMLVKLAVGALVVNVADSARIQRRERVNNKHLAGVPIHNYHLAFQHGRWTPAFFETAMSSIAHDQENWVVMMRVGMSAAELEAACAAHASCTGHGHSAVPFLELRASEEELAKVLDAEEGNVQFVEPDLPMYATPEMPAVQNEAPWGLRRVRARSLDGMPRGDPGKADGGKGVHVYVFDTGIRTTHAEFGDRAFPAVEWYTGGMINQIKACNGDRTCALDRQGHGTHCAGTVAGQTYGVAKAAMLHAVKVLSDRGAGSTAGIIQGFDWVATNAQRPAVASMSLGGGLSSAMNTAVDELSASGVTVVTASGNENSNSCRFSPGSAPSTINVGSTDAADQKSSFSNYGSCQDIWAPGSDVLSAGVASDTASETFSGTSMACPHVSGAAALLLQAAPMLHPEEVKAKLLQDATVDVVKYVPRWPPSDNLFLYMPE